MTQTTEALGTGVEGEQVSPPSPDFALGLFAALLAMAVAATAALANHRLFLTDDYATYYMPDFREIARLLGQGHFPSVTDRLWNGGAFLQEHQLALFNPVSMLLYAAIGQTSDLALAAELYALAHVGIFAAGVYFLCRVLQCAPRHAFVASVLAPLSDWIFYWGATNWISILVSLAWLTWAWGFLVLTARRPAYFPAAALAVALTLVSGWPMADLALLLSLGIAADRLVLSAEDRRLAPAAWVGLAVVCGTLLAAPALVPLAIYDAYVKRPIETGAWPAELPSLLGVGMPYFVTHWRTGGDKIQSVFSADDLCRLVRAPCSGQRRLDLPAPQPGRLATDLARGRLRHCLDVAEPLAVPVDVPPPALLSAGGSGVGDPSPLAVGGPGATLALRPHSLGCPGRSRSGDLPIAATRARLFGHRNCACRLRLGGRSAVAEARPGVAGFRSGRLLRRLLAYLAGDRRSRWLSGVSRQPRSADARRQSGGLVRSWPDPDRVLRRPEFLTLGATGWSAYAPGNIGLERPGTVVVGLSNIPGPGFLSQMCAIHPGVYCPDVIRRVTAPVAPTGRSLIDLMSVDEVTIQAPKDARAFAAWTGACLDPGTRRRRRAA